MAGRRRERNQLRSIGADRAAANSVGAPSSEPAKRYAHYTKNFSAGAPSGGSLQSFSRAAGTAVRAAAARCAAALRNGCNVPAARPAFGASGPLRNKTDSNTAPCHRANVASSLSSCKKCGQAAQRGKTSAAKSPRSNPGKAHATGGIVRRSA
jgi:hypothetical protein